MKLGTLAFQMNLLKWQISLLKKLYDDQAKVSVSYSQAVRAEAVLFL